MKTRKVLPVLLAGFLVLLTAAGAFAYESDRMDFGDIDFGGATVTFLMHHDAIAQFEEGGAKAGRLEEAKALFNIGEFEKVVVGWGEVGDVALDRFMAGDSDYDLWRVPFAFYWGLASRGAYFPVNEILPDSYFANLPTITRDRNPELAVNGRLFHFSAGVDDYGHSSFLVFNKDLLEAEGLDDPYELYENDEWTFEKISEMAAQATRDTDGDGIVDQWGLNDQDPKNLVYAYGGAITRRDDDGKVYYALDEEASVAGLRQWIDWHNVDQIASGGENEFATGQIAMAFLPFYAIGAHQDWPFSHGILPYPASTYTNQPVFLPGNADSWYIPANAEYPLGLVALDNFLFPLDEYEEELDNYISARVADRESYGILYDAMENFWPDDYHMSFLGGRWDGDLPYGQVAGDINGGVSPATAAAEAKPIAQTMIDEMFDY